MEKEIFKFHLLPAISSLTCLHLYFSPTIILVINKEKKERWIKKKLDCLYFPSLLLFKFFSK